MSEAPRNVQGMSFFTTADPTGDVLWSDPELRTAHLEARAAEALAGGVDEEDAFCPPDWTPAEAEDYVDALLDVEGTARAARALCAQQDAAFHATLVHAAAAPDAWVGPDPTLDPAWRDPRGRSVGDVRADRRDLAVRAAAADVGARVHLTDNQVRSRAYRAKVLSTRTPITWEACLAGSVSEQNMAITAQIAASLPDDAPEVWAVFDDAISEPATRLAPGRFRQRARTARERAHPESLTERHQRAATGRRVDVEAHFDGMAFVSAYVPAADAYSVDQHLADLADHLAAAPGETRTRAQLRADAFVDLLTRSPETNPDASAGTPAATVHITIPALALLGHSDEPAILDGYGPIDLDTAKQLAAGARSWTRVLTHPFTGTVVDVERRSYRVPADLRRLLTVRHPTCVFPGCTRRAKNCDMGHRKRWADGGTTSEENLAPLCEPHHHVKDETLWQLLRTLDGLRWISPSGYETDIDPPPF